MVKFQNLSDKLCDVPLELPPHSSPIDTRPASARVWTSLSYDRQTSTRALQRPGPLESLPTGPVAGAGEFASAVLRAQRSGFSVHANCASELAQRASVRVEAISALA
jgi:hypothetical protein